MDKSPEKTPQHVIIPTILVAIGIMLAISVTGFSRIHLLALELDRVIQQQEAQSALMYAMRQAAQERALHLQSMLISQDPFTVDEHALAMNTAASEYIRSRARLLRLDLTGEERALLERQQRQTNNSAEIQVAIVDLLHNEDYPAASHMMLNELLPSQNKVMAMMDEFIAIKRRQNLDTLQAASHAIEKTYVLMALLGILGITVSVFIALKVSRRIADEITHRQRTEKALRRRELHERTVRENIIDGVITLDADGKMLSTNRACEEIFGYGKAEMDRHFLGMLFPAFRDPAEVGDSLTRWERRTERGQEITGQHKQGDYFPAELYVSHINLESEDIYIAVVRDISDKVEVEQHRIEFQHELEKQVAQRTLELLDTNRKLQHEIEERTQTQQKLQHLANHDTLTGLPNRAHFSQELDVVIHQARRHRRTVALMFLDLDGFKAINDNHGHDIGDQVLFEVAGRLGNTVRHEDMVARVGGDEFVILLREIPKTGDATIVAQKLITALKRPFVIGDHLCHLGVSIGIAIFPFNADDPDTLLRLADDAMYAAKESGKNTWCLSACCALSHPHQQAD
jgi:diguanylate cyclase (GGDEF)-like protein/PAS domain S-box-containing protein